MGDSVWEGENRTLFETPDINNYQPGQTVVRGKRICTTDMCIAQDVQQENKSAPLDCKNVVQVLHKRNLLPVAESIKLSPNGRFSSIKFKSTEIMQTFCTEGLKITQYISSLTINLNQNENHALLSPF